MKGGTLIFQGKMGPQGEGRDFSPPPTRTKYRNRIGPEKILVWEHKMPKYHVLDVPFNREHYPQLVGETLNLHPSYAMVEEVPSALTCVNSDCGVGFLEGEGITITAGFERRDYCSISCASESTISALEEENNYER